MARFILRRLILILPVTLLVNFLGFSYAHLVRPLRAAQTPYLVEEVVASGPLLDAYRDYLRGLAALDLGSMVEGGESFMQAIVRGSLASLALLGLTLLLSVGIGSALGLLAARTDPVGVRSWIPFLSTIGLAMPSFFTGSLMVVAVIALTLRNAQSGFILPVSGFGWDKHLILPTVTLMLRPSLQLASVVSGLLVGEFEKQYVVAARSLGNTWDLVRRRHAMRNVLAPVLVSIAQSSRLLVGELILVEWLFDWPGLGYLLAQTLIPSAISLRTGSTLFLNPALVATVMSLVTGLFLLSDFAASGLVRSIDPRLRDEAKEAVVGV